MQNKTKKYLAWLVVGIINLMPLVFWCLVSPLNMRFISLTATLTSLGQIFGLLGMSLMATVIILGARLKLLEKYFNGLNRLYINHHLLGGIAFCLLIFHPLWLVFKYALISSQSAAFFLLPSLENIPKTLGGVALGIMMVLLMITFYTAWKYQHWKLSHKFLGLAFIVAFLHTLLIPSDVSRHLFLKVYLGGWGLLAIGTYLYRTVFYNIAVKKYEYTVDALNHLNRENLEIILKPLDKKLVFQAGQFAFFNFLNQSLKSESHPFSFTSRPDEENLKIVVKALGDYTIDLPERLKNGDKVEIEGPFGCFGVTGQRQIWVAGGIGITPFLSMAKNLSSDRQIDLYWSLKNSTEIFLQDDLQLLAQQNSNFNFLPVFSDTEGFLTAEKIKNRSGYLSGKDIFLCGPPAMMKVLKKQFMDLGIAKNNIYSEEFSL